MRKQYHFRPGPTGLDAWDVDRLVVLAATVTPEQIPLSDIRELDTSYWFGDGLAPTTRAVMDHVRLILDVDLSYPIIVDPDGGVMDGMHRVVRALLQGQSTVLACRLPVLPSPDFRDCRPEDLPYDE